jgi:hypothetical protein
VSPSAAGSPAYGVWTGRTQSVLAAGAERLRNWPVVRVVAVVVAVEWLAVAALATSVRHDGWLYYQGGDQLWYYTLGWLLGHGQLTHTIIGYGWSFLLAPVSLITGPNLVAALPAIVLFNVVILLPAAIAALYGIASRIGGRLFGYWTLVLWLVVPFLGIWYTNAGYHQRYTELTLPQSFGLTALADFPTMVAVLGSLYFCAKVATGGAMRRALLLDGAAAGAAAGIAIALKPATALFLLGPALMFLWARRFAAMGAFAVAMTPMLAALALWKARGLGNVPVLSNGLGHQEGGLAAVHPLLAIGISKYFTDLNWSHLTQNVDGLREHFWSGRLLVWLVLAGLIGLARHSRWAVILLGGALLPLTFVKASYTYANVDDASIFRILMPGFPIFIILLASVPLLAPGVGGRLATWRPAFREPGPRWRIGLLATTLVVSGLVPLGVIAAANTGDGSATAAAIGRSAAAAVTAMPVPANIGVITPTASVTNGRVLLLWHPQHQHGGRVFFSIRRSHGRGSGLSCQTGPGARWCTMVGLPEVGATRQEAFADHPGVGVWTYRIAVIANWMDAPGYGDAYYFSRPVTVTVPAK